MYFYSPLFFFATLILIFLVFNLRSRVKKLEALVAGNNAKKPLAVEEQKQPEISVKPILNKEQEVLIPVIEYIKEQVAKGTGREAIKTALLSSGWQNADIENAWSFIVSRASPSVSKTPSLEPASPGMTFSDRFVAWLKADWMIKLGAMLLLIGFGWLATYAFLNNWIGPMGRISLGLVAGALFIILGWWRIRTYLHQGGIFLVLGSTIVLLTTFAAREVYDFFTPVSSLAIMFLSTVFIAVASIKYKSQTLAFSSLVLAGLAPLFTNAPYPNHIETFAYLLVVVIGSIWVVFLTGKRELTAAALIIVSLYSMPYFISMTTADRDIILLFAYAFSALFFLTNTAGLLKGKDKNIVPDLIAAAGNGMFLLTWIMVEVASEWQSLVMCVWAIVFATGSFLIFKITARREPFYTYAGVAIAMIAAATSAELDGVTLTIAYTIESGLLILISYLVLRDIKIAERMSFVLVGPAILSFQSVISNSWKSGFLNEDFFSLTLLGSVFMVLGILFLVKIAPSQYDGDDKESKQLSGALLVFGSIYFYIVLWLSLHSALEDDNLAVMISLVVYTIVGLVCYFSGLARENRGLRLYGGILVGFVVGRLLLVDVWKMELTGRIFTFFSIGALLISTAFIGRKKNPVTAQNPNLKQ